MKSQYPIKKRKLSEESTMEEDSKLNNSYAKSEASLKQRIRRSKPNMSLESSEDSLKSEEREYRNSKNSLNPRKKKKISEENTMAEDSELENPASNNKRQYEYAKKRLNHSFYKTDKFTPNVVHSFFWDPDLDESSFLAAPVSAFKHVSISDICVNEFVGKEVGLKEGNKKEIRKVRIKTVKGYMAQIVDSDRETSFWCNILSEKICLPNKYHDKCKKIMPVGQEVETIDRTKPGQIKSSKIKSNTGRRLHLVYNQKEKESEDFFCHEESLLIHPLGWATMTGHPKHYKYVDIHKSSRSIPENNQQSIPGFKEMMKLEAVDMQNPRKICVATIMKVLIGGDLMVKTDVLQNDGSDNSTKEDTWFCFPSTSKLLFPVGFCRKNGIDLYAPYYPKEGDNKQDNDDEFHFDWETYLKMTSSIAAPKELFNHREIDCKHSLKSQMKVEAADLMEPQLICPATITEVVGRLLKIHFDGYLDQDYDQWMDFRSVDIYPVGWAEVTGHPLQDPEGYVHTQFTGHPLRDSQGLPVATKNKLKSGIESVSRPKKPSARGCPKVTASASCVKKSLKKEKISTDCLENSWSLKKREYYKSKKSQNPRKKRQLSEESTMEEDSKLEKQDPNSAAAHRQRIRHYKPNISIECTDNSLSPKKRRYHKDSKLENPDSNSTAAHTHRIGRYKPNISYKGPEDSYQCDHCLCVFSQSQSLKHHIEGIHGNVRYSCDQCDYKTTWSINLKGHIEAKHENVRYPCDQCDYKATQSQDLKRQIEGVHGTVRDPYDQCDSKATQSPDLKRHIEGVHGTVRYPCDQCEYKTTRSQHLKRHIKVKHENVRYSCDQCDYKTTWSRNLKTHIKGRHGNGYSCDQCDYKATWSNSLKRHTEAKHKKECNFKSKRETRQNKHKSIPVPNKQKLCIGDLPVSKLTKTKTDLPVSKQTKTSGIAKSRNLRMKRKLSEESNIEENSELDNPDSDSEEESDINLAKKSRNPRKKRNKKDNIYKKLKKRMQKQNREQHQIHNQQQQQTPVNTNHETIDPVNLEEEAVESGAEKVFCEAKANRSENKNKFFSDLEENNDDFSVVENVQPIEETLRDLVSDQDCESGDTHISMSESVKEQNGRYYMNDLGSQSNEKDGDRKLEIGLVEKLQSACYTSSELKSDQDCKKRDTQNQDSSQIKGCLFDEVEVDNLSESNKEVSLKRPDNIDDLSCESYEKDRDWAIDLELDLDFENRQDFMDDLGSEPLEYEGDCAALVAKNKQL